MKVNEFSPQVSSDWDGFVFRHPQGSPFHLTAWKKSIEQTYGFESHYLHASDGGAIQGVLPLFLVRNFLIGRALISSPFAVYGGILAESDEARLALYEKARKLGQRL